MLSAWSSTKLLFPSEIFYGKLLEVHAFTIFSFRATGVCGCLQECGGSSIVLHFISHLIWKLLSIQESWYWTLNHIPSGGWRVISAHLWWRCLKERWSSKSRTRLAKIVRRESSSQSIRWAKRHGAATKEFSPSNWILFPFVSRSSTRSKLSWKFSSFWIFYFELSSSAETPH